MKPLHLKDGLIAEPLINSWYAWPMLIAPATLSMITSRLHLRILESYLRAPQVHAAAARHGSLRGGMYLDCDDAVGQVRELVDGTRKSMADNLDLAAAIGDLEQLLRAKAQGSSLEGLYREVPDALRGYVELSYDLTHRPAFRFIEPLMYRSRYYKPELQAVSLAVSQTDARPFVLSTPRLTRERSLLVREPFASPRWDALFGLQSTPRRRDDVIDFLREAGDRESQLQPEMLFIDEPPRPHAENYRGDGVRIRYFGHATLFIESNGFSVLTDPIVSHTGAGSVERFGFDDVPARIDCVLLTHAHQDHVVLETLLRIRHRVGCVVVPAGSSSSLQDPSLKLMLQQLGFRNVVELYEMESLRIGAGEIVGIPFLGEHGDLAIRSKLGYLVRAGGQSVLCLADSNNLDARLYQHVQRDVGRVDTVFIGMECDGAPLSWLYGPLFTTPLERQADQSRRLNGSDAAKADEIVRIFEPGSVYVYAMGAEPWLSFISSIEYTSQSRPLQEANRLVGLCMERGITAERLYGKRELQWT